MDTEAEDLLETAYQLRRAGRADRALELLAGWPSWQHAEDRGFAQADTAESLHALGRPDEALTALQALRAARPPVTVCAMAAEVCTGLGLHDEALRFYDVGVSVLPVEQLEGLDWEAEYLLRHRAVARAAKGLAPDALDQSVPALQERRRLTLEDVEDGRPVQGEVVRALFWPHYLLAAASERWPDMGDHADLEQRLRAAAALTGRHLELVAGEPGLLQGDVEAAERYLHESDDVVRWPPERNAPCWCGSGAKYKKCCGRAALSPP